MMRFRITNGKAFNSMRAIKSPDSFQVRPVRNEDWLDIENLLSNAPRQYMALEWWTVREWLGSPNLIAAVDVEGKIAGLMLIVLEESPIVWLRVISAMTQRCLPPLIAASIRNARTQGSTGLAFLGDQHWIVSYLEQAGFQRVNQVVTLRQHGSWKMHPGAADLHVRTATLADIDAVHAVDHAAFPPLWWYSRKVLKRAIDFAYSASVACLQTECVGYQISTLRQARGHIVRLAVYPKWQQHGIGEQLVGAALEELEEARARIITVNTQADNGESLRLYDRLGFERAGQPWGVWFRSLEQT
jgi:ribosomal-protein-alanine N-acetyltransferase